MNETIRKERGLSTRRNNVTAVRRLRNTTRTFRHLSLLAIVTLLIPSFDVTTNANNLASAQQQRTRKNEKIKRLCLVSPQFPWTFGPYQNQMYKLSLLMHERGYEVYYMVKTLPQNFPTGLFRSVAELQLQKYNMKPPPIDFPLTHISAFIGRDADAGFPGFQPKHQSDPKLVVGSALNAVAQRYDLDAVIVLYDIINIVPDVRSTVPIVGWFPLHNPNPYVGSREYFSLMHTHAVASLSPSSTSILRSMMDSREPRQLLSSHSLPIRTIPHIIDRDILERDAAAGLILLKKSSPATSSVLIHQRKLGGFAVDNHGSGGSVRTKKPHPVFLNKEKDTFVVLLQGGNYDKVDRKGWDTSLQAFAKFYHRRYADAAAPPPYRIHLFVHSMESYLVPTDENYGKAIPPILEPMGVNLRHRLEILNLPASSYTLEYHQHEPEIVAAFKRRANVCLHGSKVEGFGMNVLECQALGTPVITTNYTAMGDYTKLGRAVPYEQTIYPTEPIGHDMALPSVDGMATALDEIYEEFVATRESVEAADDVAKRRFETRLWIDDVFSARRVGDAFDDVLDAALVEYSNRETKHRQSLRRGPPPFEERPMFRVVEGDFPPVVSWEEPYTVLVGEGTSLTSPEMLQKALCSMMVQQGSDSIVFSLKAVYDDGQEVPLMDKENNLHNHYPIIVRSYFLTELQKTFTRRVSLAQMALNLAMQRQAAQRIESGQFLVNRKIASGGKSNFYAYYHGNEQEETTEEDGDNDYFNGLFGNPAPDL